MFKMYISKDEKKLDSFYNSLPKIYNSLCCDLEWFYESDPACQSIEEALISYPGVCAIISYRIAHILYLLGLKNADISALMQCSYRAVCDRNNKLKHIFGTNLSIISFLHDIIGGKASD